MHCLNPSELKLSKNMIRKNYYLKFYEKFIFKKNTTMIVSKSSCFLRRPAGVFYLARFHKLLIFFEN